MINSFPCKEYINGVHPKTQTACVWMQSSDNVSHTAEKIKEENKRLKKQNEVLRDEMEFVKTATSSNYRPEIIWTRVDNALAAADEMGR